MAKIRPLTDFCLERLRNTIEVNLPLYKKSRFRKKGFVGKLEYDDNQEAIEVDLDKALADIRVDTPRRDKQNVHDVHNSKVLAHLFPNNLPPETAQSEHFWAALCHGELFDYVATRWDVTRTTRNARQTLVERQVGFIKDHFFAKDKRTLESRNAIGRLYFPVYFARKLEVSSGRPLDRSLFLMLDMAEIRQTLFENPATMSLHGMLPHIMDLLDEAYASDGPLAAWTKGNKGRDDFRSFITRMGEYCAHRMTEGMDKNQKAIEAKRILQETIQAGPDKGE